MTRTTPALGLLALAACTPSLSLAPVETLDEVVEAISWLRHQSEIAEGVRTDPAGTPRWCRAYVGPYGDHYLAYHHPISMDLLSIYRLEEWAGGTHEVLVWERPEPAREFEPEGRVL